MSLTTLSEWLRCPICLRPLSAIPPLVLGCDDGHRFDTNKRGFVSMLAAQPRIAGDTPRMLDARAQLLGSGAYDAIAHVITQNVLPHSPERILDAGCGTGHYSAAVLARLTPTARVLATDIAQDAVKRSVRRIGREHADGLVADTWHPLPVRDAAADALINVFAPRNAGEFHRVLRPHGSLVVATPQHDHLVELRRALPMLDVPAGKSERLADEFAEHFALEQISPVRYTLAVTRESAVALRTMGPSAHHGTSLADVDLPSEVTVAVDVLRFRSR